MGIVANLRGSRAGTTPEGLPISDGVSQGNKRKWSNFMPLYVALVVIAEIAFLGRLDMVNKAAFVDTLADLFYRSPVSPEFVMENGDLGVVAMSGERNTQPDSCEEWLEREDAVVYSRDFKTDPIWVSGGEQEWKDCAVGCKFGFMSGKEPDAIFAPHGKAGTASVIRSMESSHYYPENNIAQARRMGYNIVMTTSLSSDVPVGYFSWSEYDIMAPVQPKTQKSLAAAFISNCGARNFRLEALEILEKSNITLDSYGGCHRNRDGRVDKVQTLKHYKFSLAFENSNEEDYVTEKFFQSLVAGTIPVVVGAPNIQDFSPYPGSYLHIKQIGDVKPVAKTMRYLAETPDAYNQSLRWKYDGPSDSFKALVDMATVHSSCRLCIHLATMIREEEEKSPKFKKRPCRCTRGPETVYHLYVRERGRFNMESIFLRSGDLTVKALESAVLEKFKSMKHVPIWKQDRPESIRGGDELKIYRIHPAGLTQRQALYNFRFNGDADFKHHIESNPCAKFEVIFV
ncbi:glycoprotein 3-alpha-L-fucosyltransferase A isoform X1 [Tripterygium wilfordii]|uniref:Fucosyltransferase n=1 Tax=Tripterygium wilfordii TaxID=458696 RepID=A0A7J7DXU6_TRIWF|nr:glycoprotein 3-alpha-L-fucosyltransferase A [Tripterygium wilfordii]KAF5751208.1 glycoprotein 3-alpha-L-fucosyltransferase A isoform X1 [Tripterygium wilfordii]